MNKSIIINKTKYKVFNNFEELMNYMIESRAGHYKNKEFYKDLHWINKLRGQRPHTQGKNSWNWKGGIAKKPTMTREEYSKSKRNPFNNPEIRDKGRKKAIIALKEKHKDPEFIKKRMKSLTKRPNKPEKVLINLFKQHNLPYKYVGNGEVIIGRKNPDFINCNGQKKIIEMFGDAFHGSKRSFFDTDWKRTEFGTKAIYSQYGFKTLVIWESELKDINKSLNRIKKFDNS